MTKFYFSLIYIVVLFSSLSIKAQTYNHQYDAYFKEAYMHNPLIPRGILEAVAFTNTRIKHLRSNEAESCTGLPKSYGVMGLTLDGKGYMRNNLAFVTEKSGALKDSIIASPKINILAYALTYQMLADEMELSQEHLEKHIPILVAMSELPDKDLTSNFAVNSFLYSVLSLLNDDTFQKEYHLPIYNVDLIDLFGAENYKVLSSKYVEVSSHNIKGDGGSQFQQRSLGGCLDYSGGIWNSAASCNYSSRSGTAVSAVTIHTIQGSYAGAISWFQNCSASVSAHYVVRSSDGQVTQMVCETDKAWHVGSENPYTIGIEHEGYIADPQTWYTAAMYSSSAAVVRDITNSGYGINPLRTFSNPPGLAWDDVVGGCTKIKGHVNFPSQSHTDPGSGWDWERYYQLINNSTAVTSYTSGSGNFYDSGGSGQNYSDDERQLYLFSPSNSTSVTLNFSSFDVESNWDYLYIYDGNSVSDPLIGIYTGTNSPGTINSTGGELLVEFRSDCANNNIGWAATWTSDQGQVDVIPPTTTINVAGNWQTDDFSADFTDADNVGGTGVNTTYFQVVDFDGTDWSANSNQGFINDHFNSTITNWTRVAGTWAVNSSQLEQSDESSTNTNLYTPLVQNIWHKYLYHWQMKQSGSGSIRRAGIHFFCDDASLTNRGNSYFVYFRADNNKCQIYKVENDVWDLKTDDNITVNANSWYDYKITYDPSTGTIKAYQDNVLASTWTDTNPFTSGNAVSLRTGEANVVYDDFKVYRARGSSEVISIGSSGDYVRFQNPDPTTPSCQVNSIAIDNAGNWNNPSGEYVNIDWTSPANVNVNDGTGADINVTNSTTELSANWTSSSDTHSDVAKYWYAIGSSPLAVDVATWTDNGLATSLTENGLNLTIGETYYTAVAAENGAGLLSDTIVSDGQLVDISTGQQSIDNGSQLVVYPNPFTEETTLFIHSRKPDVARIELYNDLGGLIYSASPPINGEYQFKISKAKLNLAAGIYSLSISLEDETHTQRLIVH